MSKAAYAGVGDKARRAKALYVGVDDIARKVTKGYVGVDGIARQFYAAGTPAGQIPVGSSVWLNESGVPVEYMVVHQGRPGSSLYDASCDGTWLLRKDCYTGSLVGSSGVVRWSASSNAYRLSQPYQIVHTQYLSLFDADIQSAIKTVKIPYCTGGVANAPVNSGANGLQCQVFLLSCYELGLNGTGIPVDGSPLDYFKGAGVTATDKRLIAYQNGSAVYWWPRSPGTADDRTVLRIAPIGGLNKINSPTAEAAIRPALILPSDFEISL